MPPPMPTRTTTTELRPPTSPQALRSRACAPPRTNAPRDCAPSMAALRQDQNRNRSGIGPSMAAPRRHQCRNRSAIGPPMARRRLRLHPSCGRRTANALPDSSRGALLCTVPAASSASCSRSRPIRRSRSCQAYSCSQTGAWWCCSRMAVSGGPCMLRSVGLMGRTPSTCRTTATWCCTATAGSCRCGAAPAARARLLGRRRRCYWRRSSRRRPP
mmetsp:Transcript_25113/g.74217  ORF Transcript_25113/g.74217 Transcript_25113/m.74217 type:complete len:215 (+) Transcript_25113:289-933(+)